MPSIRRLPVAVCLAACWANWSVAADSTPAQSGTVPVTTTTHGDEIGIGFEVGIRRYFPVRRPMEEGQGYSVAFDFDVDRFRIGYRFELATLRSKSDDNLTGIADEVDYETQIHEIRIQRAVYDDAIHVGFAVGMASVRATLAINGDGGPEGTMFQRLAPTGDAFVVLSPITGGRRVKAAFNVILGYRILLIADADPDQAGTDYMEPISDLSGFHVGMSVSASF